MQNADDLRKNQTEAEKKLWAVLSAKKTGYKFRRQHSIGEYIVDFICIQQNLIIELDGGQHSLQAGYDATRTAFLNSLGYYVLRFWNHDVLENIEGVYDDIQQALLHPPVADSIGSAPRQRGENFPPPAGGGSNLPSADWRGWQPSRWDAQISDLATAGGDTIAIRCPAHPVANTLLAAFGGGIAAPSANRSGRVSPTTAQHVRDEFGDAVPVIDGGPCRHGIESTVLDLSGEHATILRPGSVTKDMIRYVLRAIDLTAEVYEAGQGEGALKSPGQLESHYAPSIPVRLNATSVAADEALLAFGKPLKGAAQTLNLSAKGDLIEAAANLFGSMRALDNPAFKAIAVMPVPNEGVGEAINDRLKRASS
jgi:very-short-patch-repair endonuclease